MYQLTETQVTIVAFVRGRRSFASAEGAGDAGYLGMQPTAARVRMSTAAADAQR